MKAALPCLFLFIIISCSSNTISFYVVDENQISFDTFSFYEPGTRQINSLDSLLELSIIRELESKGYKLSNNAEVYLSYSITTGRSSTSQVNNQPYQNYQSYNRNYYPNFNTTTTQYKEGVLLIELWNQEEKLLWQGSKPFKVNKSTNTQELLVQYSQVIMANFKSNL